MKNNITKNRKNIESIILSNQTGLKTDNIGQFLYLIGKKLLETCGKTGLFIKAETIFILVKIFVITLNR
jgi:beta-N-acetylglucosaminidase